MQAATVSGKASPKQINVRHSTVSAFVLCIQAEGF